jgi:hypothetical protein
MGTLATRIGGAFGILAVLVLIPSFLAANSVGPLLHVLFGLVFVGSLTSMLIRATGPRAEIYITVSGGVLWLALTAAGLAAEVAYPAAIVRFGQVTVTEFTEPLLALSVRLYHYGELGAAAMILSASISIWRTGVLPKWASALGVLGIPPLLHTWIPLPAAVSSMTWVALIGLVMLVAAKQTSPAAVQLRATQQEEAGKE